MRAKRTPASHARSAPASGRPRGAPGHSRRPPAGAPPQGPRRRPEWRRPEKPGSHAESCSGGSARPATAAVSRGGSQGAAHGRRRSPAGTASRARPPRIQGRAAARDASRSEASVAAIRSGLARMATSRPPADAGLQNPSTEALSNWSSSTSQPNENRSAKDVGGGAVRRRVVQPSEHRNRERRTRGPGATTRASSRAPGRAGRRSETGRQRAEGAAAAGVDAPHSPTPASRFCTQNIHRALQVAATRAGRIDAPRRVEPGHFERDAVLRVDFGRQEPVRSSSASSPSTCPGHPRSPAPARAPRSAAGCRRETQRCPAA